MIEQVYKMILGDKKAVEKIIFDENVHYLHMVFNENAYYIYNGSQHLSVITTSVALFLQ